MTSLLDPFHRLSQAFATDQGLKIRFHKNGEISFKTVATDETISRLVIDQLFANSSPPAIGVTATVYDDDQVPFPSAREPHPTSSTEEQEKLQQWSHLEKAMEAKAAKLEAMSQRGGIVGWFQRLTGRAKRLQQAATEIRSLAKEVDLLKGLIGPTQTLIYQSTHRGTSPETQATRLIERSGEMNQQKLLYVTAQKLESSGKSNSLVKQVIKNLQPSHRFDELPPDLHGVLERLMEIDPGR